VTGCDLTPPTREQTSEQEYSDLTASNRQQPTPRFRNTSKRLSPGTWSYAISVTTKISAISGVGTGGASASRKI